MTLLHPEQKKISAVLYYIISTITTFYCILFKASNMHCVWTYERLERLFMFQTLLIISWRLEVCLEYKKKHPNLLFYVNRETIFATMEKFMIIAYYYSWVTNIGIMQQKCLHNDNELEVLNPAIEALDCIL